MAAETVAAAAETVAAMAETVAAMAVVEAAATAAIAAAGRRRGATPSVPTDLGSLAAAARSLVAPVRPTFLGTGAFGGPWHSRTD